MAEKINEVLPTEQRISPGLLKINEQRSRAKTDPDAFWKEIANELYWFEKKDTVFEETSKPPYGRWFSGWKTNISYNALDRFSHTDFANKVAFHWIGEQGERRSYTYSMLLDEVERFAYALAKLGVRKGDRVTIYMPLIPEAVVSMLACTRLGAPHSVVFGGFTSNSLIERINDSESKVLITADGGYRRGKIVELKKIVDASLEHCRSVKHVIVVRRAGNEVEMKEGRDIFYSELLRENGRHRVEAAHVEGNEPSFILYTSGTTGKPKGVVHGTAGYMVWAYYTTKAVFGIRAEDVYWCTADIGWITGHTYVVYGPLLNGATCVLYEGAPDYPAPDRWWQIVEEMRVTILYTAPTAIRSFMKSGNEWPQRHDLSSLRLLGTVGEPINPEAWRWYFSVIGSERCPIVDTWWQTETGGIMISAQPGIADIPLKPGSACVPLPGVEAAVVDENGNDVSEGKKGFIVIKKPWPGEFLSLWNDEERYVKTYFSRFKGMYYPADYALIDRDGYFWFLGRADEVLKIAGHRIGTIELEDALIAHRSVAESAVAGKKDSIKGETPVAFVVLRPGYSPSEQLRSELIKHVRDYVGPIAEPSYLYFVEKLPKTRSGKIMRRVIRAVIEESPLGDISTLEDETSVEEAVRAYDEFRRELQRSP